MKKEQRRSWPGHFLYSTRRKLILIVTLMLSLLFCGTFLGVDQIMKQDRYETLTKQYYYVNRQMISAFEKISEELDQLTEKYILNEYVQKTLTNQEITASDLEMMKKSLAFYNRSYLDYYLVIDNKENLYSQKKVTLDFEKFQKSQIYRGFGDHYSKTVLMWARDVIFGTNEMSFFVVRHIRGLNVNHEPGMLILKLNENLLDPVRDSITDDQLSYFILNENQEVCFSQMPGGARWNPEEAVNREILQNVISRQGMETGNLDWSDGIVSWDYDENSCFTVVTYASKEVTDAVISKIQGMMLAVFFITYGVAVLGIILFSSWFTKPIQYISETMRSFDEQSMGNRIDLNTNTELDEIGQAYNKMVVRVKELMEDVKQKEGELRESELASLMYQIRPHFLYNTLDTIYMLARIQKEETIMRMIQSLSRFLRINLSNGNEQIETAKELEHVSSYLEIQKIRNADLFEYETHMEESVASWRVIKMILQPVAENCIKYGFCDIEEGGKILISAGREGDFLVFTVENNGTPIGAEQMEKLNRLESAPLGEMDEILQYRQGGYGIRNVVKRLRLRYGDEVRFYYRALEGGTVCVIKIPVKGEGGDGNE